MNKHKHKERTDIIGRRKFLTFIARQLVFHRYYETVALINKKWLQMDSPYILREGWPQFSMNISSLMALIDTKDTFNETNVLQNIREWFDKFSRKQLGAHLITTRFGKIQMVYTCVDSKSEDIHCSDPHDINAVYPVIRYEENVGDHSFVVGLFFGSVDQTKNRNTGNRLHHRYGYKWLQIENCWEMDEKFFEEKFVRHWHRFETKRFFALYVCYSTKLIVQDNCVEKGHTRSLVQQGGIVVIEGELCFRVKEVDSYYTFGDCFSDGILVPIDKSKKDFENPVLFLGANDSSNDSISWELTIIQKKDDKTKSVFILFLPEGGRFEAIEEWDRGIDEVWARHSYLRLFESNITYLSGEKSYSSISFRTPDRNLMERILGLSDRSVKCIHGIKLSNNTIEKLSKQRRLFPNYNFRKLVSLKETLTETKNLYGLSIPPPYPPIEYKSDNTWHYIYLPNNKEMIFKDSLFRHEIWVEFVKDSPKECCYEFDGNIYRLKKDRTVTLDEYELIKCSEQLPNTLREYERWALCDGQKVRLGTDGWLYQSTGKVIASFETKYYYRYDGPVPKYSY